MYSTQAKFYAVLADETTDCSGTEQMSICIRFEHKGNIREEFMEFVEISDMTGTALNETMLL